ncbi:unnamed protein product [Discosporangium mesarthrocarpum]
MSGMCGRPHIFIGHISLALTHQSRPPPVVPVQSLLLPSLPFIGAFLIPVPLIASSSTRLPQHSPAKPNFINEQVHRLGVEAVRPILAVPEEAGFGVGSKEVTEAVLSTQEEKGKIGSTPGPEEVPLWNLPNILTLIRVAAIPFFTVIFYTSIPARNMWCSAIFAGAAATDWLDGYIARKEGIVTPFGAFLDPVADKLMVSTALILLSQRLGPWMAICTAIILCREIGVSALREWMAQLGLRDTVKVGAAGKWKTAMQMIALTLLLLLEPGALSTVLDPIKFFPLAKGLLVISTVLTVTSGSGYLQAAWPVLMGRSPSGSEGRGD